MANKLLQLFPNHKIYCEAFGGSAAVLLNKPPSPVEIYNDLDSGLVNFFRVLRDRKQFKQLQFLTSLTPYAREEFEYAQQNWRIQKKTVDQAHMWFTVARMCFSGMFENTWGYSVTASSRGMAAHVSSYLSAIENLPQIHSRLMRVQIDHRDAFEILNIYDTNDTFFYLDPPYVPSTRRSGQYKHELSEDDHEKLVARLLSVKGKVMLSGYQNPTYARLEEKGWRRMDWKTTCSAAAKTRLTRIQGKGSAANQVRIESIWLNYQV